MNITDHHDGFGLNDSIEIEASDFTEQGKPDVHPRVSVPHRFYFKSEIEGTVPVVRHGSYTTHNIHGILQFQNGPRDEPGSTPGLTSDAVIHALLAYLRAANRAFPSKETSCAITHLEEAAHWLHARARERARRGVLGKAKA